MPNTDPVTDNGTVVEFVKSRAAEVGHCRVYPSGAMTRGLKGEAMSEMGDMSPTAPSPSPTTVAACRRGHAPSLHGLRQDVRQGLYEPLPGRGSGRPRQINEGKVSTRLALEGWPAAGEELQIARDIEIAKLTGAKLHIQHISTAHGLELVRAGKAAGVQVTCEATPHHMFLTENDLDETYNTSLKVNPPLRTDEDAEAIRQGVIDGTVDAIVTDHAPHTPWEKAREFELAPFGMIGLETSLSLVLTELVNTGKMSVSRMVELMAIKPREILGLDQVQVKAGSVADLTVFDPSATWTVGEDGYESRAENSGFAGRTLTGRATDVFVGGKQTLADGCIC